MFRVHNVYRITILYALLIRIVHKSLLRKWMRDDNHAQMTPANYMIHLFVKIFRDLFVMFSVFCRGVFIDGSKHIANLHYVVQTE